MKHKPILLLCLLVGPALARPNAAHEPIYYRSSPQSNPLEVTEELIPTTLAIASNDQPEQPQSDDLPKALELKGTTTTTEVPVTTTASSATTQDQNSRYTKYAEPDVLSSESIIKDFFLKNLANFQKESNFEAIPSLVEEPNTLRSVSLSPNWGDPGPDPQYGYTNVRKKPVIHKIITKWSDKTQDAFNVDFTGQHGIVTPGHLLGNFAGTTGFIAFPTATPVPVIIVAKPVYPENTQQQQQIELSLLDDGGYSPEPERDVTYGGDAQNDVYEPQNDVYEPQNDGYQVQQDPIDTAYAEPPKQVTKKKKKKNKNKTKKPEKQQQQSQTSDPDRPDAAYWNDQVEQFEPSSGGWTGGQDDPYEEKDPYADALGALKDQPVIECNGIRITVNGKEACDEIEVTINRVDEITKNGFVPPPPLIPPVVPVAAPAAAADPVPAAAGNAAAVAADPAAAATPVVANDASLFAAPLDPLASIPAVVPPPFPGPISFLTSPIGNLMNNLVQPTRLGSGTAGGNKHKHKPHHEDVLSDDSGGGGGGSSMLTDTSHALFGMLAALSAMTPMNIIVMALASLPVMALVMAGIGAGMYMYSKFTPPIKNYSTIVVKRPLPVVPASIHRYRQPVKAHSSGGGGGGSSSGWFDFGDMWNNIGWTANDRRGVGKVGASGKPSASRRPSGSRVVQPAYRLSPYRGHSRPESKKKTEGVAATTKWTGR